MSDQGTPLKRCGRCKQWFPATLEFFHRGSDRKDGFSPSCKACEKTRHAIYNYVFKEYDESIQKQCRKCLQYYPATPDFFHRRKESKDGLRACCIACEYPERGRPMELTPKGMKQCSQCGQWFPSTLEFFHARKGDVLKSACKKCRNIANRDYYLSHLEAKRRYQREHRDEIRARMRRWSADNKESLAAKKHQRYQLHLEDIKEYGCRYRREHREYIRMWNKRWRNTEHGRLVRKTLQQKREAHKRGATGNLTSTQIQEKLRSQHYRCYYAACGHAKFEKRNGKYIYHTEHTIPLSRTEHNPRHDINYVVLSCPDCNLKKGAKLPHEWPEGGRLL